jgi:outer membrane protein insertion porin family
MNHTIRQLFRKIAQWLALAVLTCNLAWAVEPFEMRDIRVEGLQRVEPGTVFASLPFRVGDTYTDEKGTAAIRGLFALGLFKDVRIEVNGNVVVVVVEERPVIAAVDFIGTKEFEKDTLKKALRDIGLTEGRAFDKALADRAEQELKRQYINRSLYGAEIITTITPIDRNRVNLSFNVVEGDVAKIKEIKIVGNKAFSEATLRDQLDLNTGNWLSWYTKNDRYARNKLNADLEILTSYYLARGFLEFRIDSTQVSISPNRQDISITINITEGQRFVVSSVKLEGYFLGRDDEFKALITIKPGQTYNANDVAQTVKSFTEYFGNFGYAFARVEPRPDIDRGTDQVSVVLQAEPSRRAYVRRVNVTGNTRTRDEIIRREMRQMESAWYDGDRIRMSRDRIERLGYFKDVSVDTQEVPGAPDQVDLVINVSEKPTGSLQLGAGYSSFEKFFLTFGIQQDNIFGSGNFLGAQVSTSKYNQIFSINTTDPYFTPDGISRTYDLYHRSSRPYIEQAGNYRLVTSGLGLRFGIPFSELDKLVVGVAMEQTTIKPGTSIPAAYLDYADRFGYTSASLPLTLGWTRDSRDSALVPTRGVMARLYSDLSFTGDTHYTRSGAQYQRYFPINKQFSFALNGEVGYGKGLSGLPFPIFKNYFVGGLGSVRGFDQGSLGPRDITGLVVGGAKKLVFNAEVFAPFPGAGNDKTLRLYGFYDAGNVFSDNEKISFNDLRSSVGAGISWVSPMGPLRLAIANPINKVSGDRIQRLQFQIGTSF